MTSFLKSKVVVGNNKNKKVIQDIDKNEKPFLLRFLQKQITQNEGGKRCISHRNNQQSIGRSFKTSQSHFNISKIMPKISIRSRYEQQIEGPFNIHPNNKILNKQNRPSSMNQLQYKGQSSINIKLCKTGRYHHQNEPMYNSQKQQINFQRPPIKIINNRLSKYKILKSLSRANIIKTQPQEHQCFTQSNRANKNACKNDKMFAKLFKKSLIKDVKQPINLTNSSTLSDSKLFNHENKFMKQKDDKLFGLNFSTIKLKQVSESQFITRQAVDELIQPQTRHINFQGNLQDHNKRRKLEIQKIRKKFPSHFFR